MNSEEIIREDLQLPYRELVGHISTVFTQGQTRAMAAVHSCLVETYWKIGQYIVEYEQKGKEKATYGSALLENLSRDLKLLHGKRFSLSNVKRMRQLYIIYPISAMPSHQLSWSHYVELLKIDDDLERSFYEQQTQIDNWSVAELKRQKDSALFMRMALSKDKTNEVNAWDDITFLNKAKITIKGKITRAAIILLGKEEAEHYLVTADAKIRWVLKTLDNQNKDYEICSIPFLLAVDKVFNKIRNLKYRYLPDGTLFPNEVLRYEPFVIRESLNNVIAHQDYTKGGRINVVEVEDDHLIVTNLGSFIPGSIKNVIDNNAPEEHYRNKFWAMAMFNLNPVEKLILEYIEKQGKNIG